MSPVPTPDLSPKRQKALLALLAGAGTVAAAKAAGVSRRTVHRWKGEESFVEALAEGQRAIMAEATDRLVGLVERAVDAVEAAVDSNPWLAVRLLDGIGLLTRSLSVSVSTSTLTAEPIPPHLNPQDTETVIEMGRRLRGLATVPPGPVDGTPPDPETVPHRPAPPPRDGMTERLADFRSG